MASGESVARRRSRRSSSAIDGGRMKHQHALFRPLPADLGPALPVDVEEVVLPVLERPVDRVDGGPVARAVNHRPLGEFAARRPSG